MGGDLKGSSWTYNGSAISTSSSSSTPGIGGDGSDGAISLSANTSYGAVVNATSFTVTSGGYKVYPALNKPLCIKASGAATFNDSTLSGTGRGYLEPA